MGMVFFLQHRMNYDGQTSRKPIGVYRSAASVERALARLSGKPGFRDPQGHFLIHVCTVDKDYLPHGFDDPETGYYKTQLAELASIPEASADAVYRLYNQSSRQEVEYDDDFTLIGLYSSHAAANHSIERLKGKSEFSGNERKFGVDRYAFDDDHWAEGFISVQEAMKDLD